MVRYALNDSTNPDRCPSVVILEDEVNWATAVARLMHSSITKLHPACFTNVADTTDYLRTHEVDLLFVDLNVTDSHGLATLERIRMVAPLSAIVVMTGETDEQTALEALRCGAQDYLVKGKLDSYTLRHTARFAIERTQTMLKVYQLEQLLTHVLDALPSALALLDETGIIVMTNNAWNDYTNPSNPLIHGCKVGSNYLAVCDQLVDTDTSVHAVAKGVLLVLAGLEERFTFKYFVQSQGVIQWLGLTATE